MAKDTKLIYSLDLRIPKSDKQLLEIEDVITIGSDGAADVCIQEFNLAPLHCKFRLTNEVLTLTNLGGHEATKIGRQKLSQGKMYIIDKGDKIIIGDIKIHVKQDKVKIEEEEEFEEEYEDDEELVEEELEITDPSIVADSEDEDIEIEIDEEEIEEDIDIEIEDEEVEIEEEAEEEALDKTDEITIDPEEEEEEEEEEEDEPEEIEDKKIPRKGFFGIGGKSKKPEIKAAPNFNKAKKKSSVVPKGKGPGFITRGLGFLTSIVLVWAISFFVLPQLNIDKQLHKQLDPLVKSLPTHIKKIPSLTKKIPKEYSEYAKKIPFEKVNLISPHITYQNLTYLLIFIALEIIGHLIFGTSLPLALLGVAGGGSFIGNRFKGLIRALLGIILFPFFIILDLPAVFKKRTFKEVISLSFLKIRSKSFQTFGFIILIPSLWIGILFAPLLLEITELLEPVNYSVEAKKPKRKKAKKSNYSSESFLFGLKVIAKLSDDIKMFPTFKMKKGKITPVLQIFDLKKKTKISWKVNSPLDLTERFKEIPNDDPLMPYFASDLHNFLSTKKESPLVQTQVSTIIKNSISLSAPTIHEFILKRGIFFKPYLNIRKDILKSIKLERFDEVEEFSSTRTKYIAFNGPRSVKLAAVNGTVLDIQEFSFKPKSKKLFTKIKGNLIKKSLPLSKTMKEIDFTAINKWSAFNILDFFHLFNSPDLVSVQQLQPVIKYFINESKFALKMEDEKYKKILIKNFKMIDKALIKLNKSKPNLLFEQLQLGLNRTQKALEKGDQPYFNVN